MSYLYDMSISSKNFTNLMILPKICLALKLRRAIEDGLGKREAKAMAKEAPSCFQIKLSFQYVDFLDVFSGEASIVSQLGDSPRGITGPTFPGFPHGAVRGVACRDVTAGSQEAMKIGETSWVLDTMSVIPLYS